METDLQKYKAKEISKINAKFNSDMALLKRNYNRNVSTIKNLRQLTPRNKTRALTNLLNQFNRNVRNLKNRRIINIRKINAIKILPNITTSDSTTSNKYALLVGINYTNTSSQLYGCINDVTNIKNLLQQQYSYNNIVLLTDNTNKKPTRKNILEEFTSLLKNAASGDYLFFHYSGHGSYTYDINADEKDGQDETIVPIDFQQITDDEIRKIVIDNIKPDVKLFALFDCCHSGTIMDLKYNYLDSGNFDNLTINNKINDTIGKVTMISGCLDEQTSADAQFSENNTIKWQGAMTWSFLNTLKNQSSNIHLKSLIENMRSMLKQSNFSQIPQLSSGTSIDINNELLDI